MKCSVFIATSADGYIATENGGVEWLETAGNQAVDLGNDADMGFNQFIKSVDCMIIGRKCMEKLSSFNLSPEQWPYGDLPIYALSHTVKTAPTNLHGKVEMYAGDIPSLVALLQAKGLTHAYVDGGAIITSFLNLQLINQIIITQAPVLLGEGIPLFGKLSGPVQLSQAATTAYPNDFIQFRYDVSYS